MVQFIKFIIYFDKENQLRSYKISKFCLIPKLFRFFFCFFFFLYVRSFFGVTFTDSQFSSKCGIFNDFIFSATRRDSLRAFRAVFAILLFIPQSNWVNFSLFKLFSQSFRIKKFFGPTKTVLRNLSDVKKNNK